MASRVAAVLLLGVICFGLASGEMAMDCCLQASSKRLPSRNLVSYIIQDARNGCEKSATVFITNAGRQLCVLHPSQAAWVQKLISILDKKKESSQ
ncbi:C-C motif chemokine 21-like [Mugil cephalus]|uniref:C-C motif chemokine 21-like n=1 Tax=Mugil cephalus TaxID=48193 RepID=UPI001FB58CCE|nr:C-C motif chemokine 21-like [Mugil cephalus]